MARSTPPEAAPEPATLRLPLGGRAVGDDLLLPPNSPGVPGPVTAAEALVREPSASYHDASLAVRSATAEVKASARLDTLRDAEAVAAGVEMPTDRLTDQARQTLTVCRQRQQATLENLRQHELTYGYEVSKAHPEWSARQDEIVADAEVTALQLLDEFGRALDTLNAARSIQEGLASWPVDGGSLREAHFQKQDQKWQEMQREQAEQDLQRADEQGFVSRKIVDRDAVSLLTALRAEVVGTAEERRLGRAAW